MVQDIKFESDSWVAYPVGTDVESAIKLTTLTGKLINDIITDNYRNINLWCIGSSGSILATLLASNLLSHEISRDVRVCHLKKEGEISHVSSALPLKDSFDLIVDDFIDTGSTIDGIFDKISHDYKKVTINGVVLHGSINSRSYKEKLFTRPIEFVVYDEG